jgi:hypothetical protein
MTRTTILVFAFSLGAVALSIACSDDDSTNNSSSGGTSSGGTSSGGTSGASGGTSGSTFKSCSTGASSSGTSSCSEAEFKPYSDCYQEKCEPAFAECYGASYKTGTFSGACGAFITCTQKCACNDLSCYQSCTQSEECKTCSQKFVSCGSSCQLPACATGGTDAGGGGGGKTCADLLACCNKLADAEKTQCTQTHSAAGGNNTACNAIFSGYASKCP